VPMPTTILLMTSIAAASPLLKPAGILTLMALLVHAVFSTARENLGFTGRLPRASKFGTANGD
jgi:hypothetical protein